MYSLSFWFRLGWISFGGPAGQIALMHRHVVEEKKWVSDARFLHALNYCMLLPGPEAQQLATYLGFLLHGYWGGIVAGTLFVLPSMLVLWLLSYCYVTYSHLPVLQAIFYGIQAAMVAIVALALVKIAKKSLRLPLHFFIAGIAFVAAYWHISFPWVVGLCLLLAIGINKIQPEWLQKSVGHTAKQENEADFLIKTSTELPHLRFSWTKLCVLLLVGVLLWYVPYFLLDCWANGKSMSGLMDFWANIRSFFTKAAFVTFGGAYAVLPYVAQTSVEQFRWLQPKQMLDGLALGESTPGPLIMVLAFVGFMAGYNQFNHSLSIATITLVLTTYYTFLPSFLFILAGAPLIEYTHQQQNWQRYLGLIAPAVVGLMSYLVLYLAQHTFVQADKGIDGVAILWCLLSVVALYRYQIGMMTWIAVSCLFGVLVKVFLPFLLML
ncbi:MAG: chromate efflux transporter [Chitinophagales bacterium]|nr:chromate efflux transporter [Chitinophagales bacterium]